MPDFLQNLGKYGFKGAGCFSPNKKSALGFPSDIEDVVAIVLNRSRHEHIIHQLREAGARIKLIDDGDVAGAIKTVFDNTGVDILFGSGGAPEGD